MKVARILDISPTVKEVVLKSDIIPPKITFKAGQWYITQEFPLQIIIFELT